MSKESIMDVILKELASRKDEIQKEVEMLFNANMKITDWDVPEADDKKAAEILLSMIEEKLAAIRSEIVAGKYDYN
jgi:hypothetical protein